MSGQNHREFSRVGTAIKTLLTPDAGSAVEGTLRDVSATGIFMTSADTVPEGTECAIFIQLTDDPEGIGVRARGAVVRCEAGGMAVRIDAIAGENSFEHLRRLVLYNAPDPDGASSEFDSHIGIKPET